MNRIYCDYNATSPLASSVKEYLAKGDFHFANPASIHTSGKKSRFEIAQITEFLKSHFGLKTHDLFYHSGATEGINTILRDNGHLFYFTSDHPCVTETAKNLDSTALKIGSEGLVDIEEVIQKINKVPGKKILNFTWVHNETGIVWDLTWAQRIKQETDCLIHVDAAQVVGKIKNYRQLNPHLDFYTFSAHKFGALKGIGWSFFRKSNTPKTLFFGGGQQKSLRSGTENSLAIKTIELALLDTENSFSESLLQKKNQIEQELKKLLGEQLVIIGENSPRNLNTINFIYKKEKADVVLTAFDLQGLEVGTGSACASASVKKSQTLIDMGYGEYAAYGVRISLGQSSNVSDIINCLSQSFHSL